VRPRDAANYIRYAFYARRQSETLLIMSRYRLKRNVEAEAPPCRSKYYKGELSKRKWIPVKGSFRTRETALSLNERLGRISVQRRLSTRMFDDKNTLEMKRCRCRRDIDSAISAIAEFEPRTRCICQNCNKERGPLAGPRTRILFPLGGAYLS